MSTATIDSKGVVIVCPKCGQKNRIPYGHLGEVGTCGRCRAELPPPAEPIEIADEAQFNSLIGASSVPVVVDFWAPWCGPCRMVAPELEKVAARAGGKFVVAKLNTEQVPSVAHRFDVRSIPMMAVFVRGREAARTAGACPASAIEAFIGQAIG